MFLVLKQFNLTIFLPIRDQLLAAGLFVALSASTRCFEQGPELRTVKEFSQGLIRCE